MNKKIKKIERSKWTQPPELVKALDAYHKKRFRITISEQTTYEVEADDGDDAYEIAHCYGDAFSQAKYGDVCRIIRQETNTTDGPDLILPDESPLPIRRGFGVVQTCCLCGAPLDDPYGHNPAPLGKEGDRACGDCNATKVIPARLSLQKSRQRG